MKKFYSNLLFAILAQFISTLFSLLMYLIVPKYIGNINYAYWQLFLFYSGYAGFFHLGLVDGIYLKLGGNHYEDLNFKSLSSQLKMMTTFQIVIGIIFSITLFLFNVEINRKFVIFSTIVYIIIYCIENYLGFVLQAVNKTQKYSIAVIMEKIISLIVVVVIIYFKIDNYKPYIYTYLLAKLLNVIYLIYNTKEIVFSKVQSIKLTVKECFGNIKIGSILMFSTIASSLVIGSGRMIIDNIWGIEIFGKISFSISMVNMILLFIRQVSMVMFPALRQVTVETQRYVYNMLKKMLEIFLPMVFLVYVPISKILMLWLPEYQESIEYLSIILPICVFDAKMQVLCNTYFKVLRKEKMLLKVNIFSMGMSLFLAIICGYFFNSMIAIVYSMVVTIVIRSVMSEIYLNKVILNDFKNITNITNIFMEIIITIIFMVTINMFSELISCACVLVSIVIYFIINRKDINSLYDNLKNKLFKKEEKLCGN